MLGLLTASAFFVRLDNFKNSQMRSIDEIVYFRMAGQVLEEGPSGYHTMPFGKEMADGGRPLPAYFFKPLFKHPPLFTLLVSLSMKIFGAKLISAGYIPLLFGALMIPLTYLLAALIFNRNVGMLSAAFMWLDPVNIICSQKVWMETTLAFLIVLSVYLFMRGFKGRGDIYFVLGGLASGLAVLTKYPGILSLGIVLLYATVQKREVFKNKYFLLGLAMPALLLALWFYWNYAVYGMGFFVEQAHIHHILVKLPRTFAVIALALILAVFVSINLMRSKKDTGTNMGHRLAIGSPEIKGKLVICVGLLLAVLIRDQIMHGLQFNYLPMTTWYQGIFTNELPTFYIGRLIEFSALFIFSFAAFFIGTSKDIDKKLILYLSSSVILLFFIVWRSYQSRYILPAIPFLVILGVAFFMQVYQRVSASRYFWIRVPCAISLKFFLIYVMVKTCYLNAVVSFPNDMCYF